MNHISNSCSLVADFVKYYTSEQRDQLAFKTLCGAPLSLSNQYKLKACNLVLKHYFHEEEPKPQYVRQIINLMSVRRNQKK